MDDTADKYPETEALCNGVRELECQTRALNTDVRELEYIIRQYLLECDSLSLKLEMGAQEIGHEELLRECQQRVQLHQYDLNKLLLKLSEQELYKSLLQISEQKAELESQAEQKIDSEAQE